VQSESYRPKGHTGATDTKRPYRHEAGNHRGPRDAMPVWQVREFFDFSSFLPHEGDPTLIALNDFVAGICRMMSLKDAEILAGVG
jgi:hypothetical protein